MPSKFVFYKQDLYEYIIEVLKTEPSSLIQQESLQMCQDTLSKIKRDAIKKSAYNKAYYEKKKQQKQQMNKQEDNE